MSNEPNKGHVLMGNINIGNLQCEDPELKHFISWVQEGTLSNWGDISDLSKACQFYWESLECKDKIPYYVHDGWKKEISHKKGF